MHEYSGSRLSRRQLLRLMAGGGAALFLGGRGLSAGSGDAGSGGGVSDDMILREIPGTGEKVPVAGMGTYRTFNVNPAETEAMERMRNVLQVFLEGGGRVIDSSPMYGQAERVVGLLAEELDAVEALWMATKVWTRGRDAGVRQMRESMRLMGKQPMDLMQVHNLVDVETHLGTLKAWKDEGRIRYMGITHYQRARHDDLVDLIERYPLDFAQFNYNLLDRNAETRLLPACAEHGVATLANEPFAQGRLFRHVGDRALPDWAGEIGCRSWAQVFLKYLIAHPAVTAVIPATSNPDHAADNVAAGRGPLPDADMRRRIREAV